MILKKDDHVVMHTCGEAEYYRGKIWTCRTDQFNSSSGSPVVFLDGFSGYFLVEYLQFVDLEGEKPVDKWTKTDLLITCKNNKVKGYTRMSKSQLIEEVKKTITNK